MVGVHDLDSCGELEGDRYAHDVEGEEGLGAPGRGERVGAEAVAVAPR